MNHLRLPLIEVTTAIQTYANKKSQWCAAAIGFITAIIISLLQDVNDWIGIDKVMDVFKLHGLGETVGSFLTGIFSTASVSSLDGATLAPGGIGGNGIQVGKQFAEITGISSYAFTISLILCYILKYIPRMYLRVSDQAEMVGLDLDQFLDEKKGDWSLFDHTSGIPQNGETMSTPATPSFEEESKVQRFEELFAGFDVILMFGQLLFADGKMISCE